MKAENDDHLAETKPASKLPVTAIAIGAVVVAAAVAVWFFNREPEPEPIPAPVASTTTTVTVPEQPEIAPAPDIPERDMATTVIVENDAMGAESSAGSALAEEHSMPSMEEADDMLMDELSDAGVSSSLMALLNATRPMDSSAAVIDGLGKGLVLKKIIQVKAPPTPFKPSQVGELYYMDEANYSRYDSYANAIKKVDTDTLVTAFHRFRPLYERACEALGLDSADFDNGIIRAIDLVLATPEIEEPIALKTKSVSYLFADPSLEKLTPLQKQLLRMGPDNIRVIKQQAQELREGLMLQ